MSIIFTADFQCDFGNIDRCQQAWDEILEICKKESIKYIAVLGDLKQAMNPVDIRVVKWWQNAIRKAKKFKYEVIIMLGNHDRVGAYSNSDNWLSILRRAGAITFDKPGTFIAEEITLCLLPFDNETNTRLGARKCKERLSRNKKTNPNSINILCFHQDLTGARYNQQGSKSDAKLSASDLFSSSYDYVIGGDIHLPQIVKNTKNVYYVGSPFCHDWGECNQLKRYIIVGKSGLQSVFSRIPRWYDPSVAEFQNVKPKSWKGTRIRYTVQCDASKDYGRRLEKARRRAERKYKGAEIYVIPKFESSRSRLEGFSTTDSDKHKITQYVLEMASGRRDIREIQSRLIKYMLKVLSQFEGGLRQGNKVKFISAKGKNFLSFKKVELDLTKKGITLVQGINHDRNKKSNGSGKTSLVQILPVCFFGRTFKDQKSDAWANRHIPKEKAKAGIILHSSKREICISRERHPIALRMEIDGKEVSSGMRSTDKDGTQKQIEQITGFTWQTLANAVYIDRSIADAFLSGTNKQRTDVLSRFQNLERFERALEQVKQDIKSCLDKEASVKEKYLECKIGIKHTLRSIKEIKIISDNQLKEVMKQLGKAERRLKIYRKDSIKRYKAFRLKAGYINNDYRDALKIQSELDKEEGSLGSNYGDMKRKLVKANALQTKKECPTCFQKVSSKWIELYKKGINIVKKDIKDKLKDCERRIKRNSKRVNHLSEADESYKDKITEIKNKERELELAEKQLQRQYQDLQAKQHNHSPVSKAKSRLSKLKREKNRLKDKLKYYEKKSKIYRYAAEAFSRDGIPSFLNNQLCPVLNRAAAYYAELFSDSEVQVQFTVEEGEFVPKIINANGGAEIGDQSEGEKALAGLIASFSLREAAPETNLLVLDEPGAGLDEQTARQFARSLRRLVKRFKAIYVVTHNPAILSELSNERTLTIVKKNKISQLEAA